MATDAQTTAAPFAGVRVLEVSTGITASYCGKLFADAGAEVVKLEPATGDPLRRWSASGAVPADGADGALFAFLNTSKHSVVGELGDPVATGLLRGADVLLLDEGAALTAEEVRALHQQYPEAVVAVATPFGLSGPYVEQGRKATEFVLQAMCGSAAGRGVPESTPLQAGGRIGEWVAGAYLSVAGAAALRGRRKGGSGRVVDLSVLECMVMTMGGLATVAADLHPEQAAMQGRSIELPSIEPTADGLVGLCTITNQQFQDFLVMIDRADLLADSELALAPERMRRREEFTRLVREWTTKRTTQEVLEIAAAMRIPVAPIGSPETVTAIDHFAARGVFTENPAGFTQPRTPYRIGDFRGVPAAPAPRLGADTVHWPPRPAPAADSAPAAGSPQAGGLPLHGLRVLDLTAFWAGPSATAVLAALGADVIKVEGLRRPDGMRYSGGKPPSHDKWWETGSVFLATNTNKRGVTLELSLPQAQELALRLAGACDIVIENFSPRVLGNLGLDPERIRTAAPHAVVVRMPAFGLDGPWRDRVGFAQTMEQASGMAWLTGTADGPPLIPRGPCDPIAGLHAVFATLAALEQRDRAGHGALVESTMVEAALNVAAEAIVEHAAYGKALMRDGNRGPVGVPQGIYRCAGEDDWVALAVTDDAGWAALCSVLERPDLADDPELGDRAGRRAAHDRIDAAIAEWSAGRTAEEAAEALHRAGLAAARVAGGADLFDNPQLAARGFFERIKHPVSGEHRVPGMPFHFLDEERAWITRAAPTLGEHTRQVLTELLDLDDTAMQQLGEAGVIGDRPFGL